MSNSLTNESFIYAVSNKRAKLNLDSALLWHCHLRHISKKRIEKLQHDGLLDSSDLRAFEKCVSCMSGKMARKPYTHQVERAKDLLGLIHTDVCGPFKIMSGQGASYFVTFNDDFNRYGYVYLLKHKHEVFETFKVFQKEVENQLGKTIKSLRSDREGEYISQDFLDHLKDHGIIPHRTPPYTPQHNGVSERRNRTLLDMVEKTPYEVWHGKAPKLSYLKVWGCEALVKRDTLTKPDKLEPRSIKCIFVGYPKEMIGYSFFYPPENKEHKLGDLGEPANYKVALLEPEFEKWLNAMNVEMQSMKDNEVWVLVELPPNGKTVGRIDYKETFSPVADIRAIRILIAIAAYYDYEIWQMDVKTALLYGYLNEEVYMEQPEASGSNITFLILYVDDILIMGNNISMLQSVKSYLGRCFAMKDLGEVAYILGIKIYRDRSRRLISLCQSAYIKKILKPFCMENSKRRSIPMQEKLKLSKSQDASTPAELKRMHNVPYASAVGSIMVFCYTDAGYLTDADDLKSQTGYVFILNGGAINWKSAKQSIFATSSAEAEYITVFDASKEAVWVRKFIYGSGVVLTVKEPISMYCDNTRAIAIANESGITKGARHFRAKVHYLCEVIEYSDIKLEKVHTYDNLADPFTKALAFPKHSEHTRNIRMLPASSLIWNWKPGILHIISEDGSLSRAIAIANESGITKGARHFRAKVHYLREVIELGDIKLEKVHTDENLADPFTKALAFPKHSEHTKNIGMLPASSLINKRAKLDLESALLWHCRLGHISKKCIEKLQHDGLLDSSDVRVFEKCVSCMSGKMARKPYTHQVERAKELLGLIHIDVCGPFKIMLRQGASYFVTFTDDFSRYGYVYLLKHKHEVFETFKVFQKEVENQLGEEKQNPTRYGLIHDESNNSSKVLLGLCIKTATRILNMVPTKKGCEVLVKRDTLTKPDKLEPRSIKCIFVGYPKETMGYSFYYPPENKVLVARNAEFLKNSLINQEASGSLEDLEIIQEKDTHPSIDTSLNHEEDDLEIDEPQRDLGEPANYKAALLDPESEKWLNAMNVEMQSMKDNKVWVLVEFPSNGKTIGSKWLFKKKTDMDGNVYIYKARLMAKGYTQTPGIDYEETFSLEKLKLSKSQGASTPAELKRMQNVPYASTVGSIMYAVRCTRPDAANTKDMFLVYEGDLKRELRVSSYTDAGYLTDAYDLKSQTGYVFILNGGAVDWKSAKQSIFATSSVEAEYIAAFDASKEAIWVRKFIFGLSVVRTIEEPISMYFDNTGAIIIANESGITKGARHFCAKVHYLREVIEFGDIILEKVHTDDN
nr:hypothetical protein [Tanacetum cinerariifolium]